MWQSSGFPTFVEGLSCHYALAPPPGVRHDAPRFEGARLHGAYGSSGRQNEDSRERHAETPGTGYHQTHRRRVVRRASRRRILGPGPPRLRHQGLSLGPEEIRRPVARPRRVEEGDAWTARETHRRRGAAPGGGGHRPHQAGRGTRYPLPPEPEPTMAVLAERYMRDYVPSHCRTSSAEVYRRALDNHILPVLGEMRVGAVGREQVMELHYAMRGERLCGERGAEDRGQGAVAGRRMGPAGARAEPVPGGAQVPDAPARAVLDGARSIAGSAGRSTNWRRRGRCRAMRRRRSGCWC